MRVFGLALVCLALLGFACAGLDRLPDAELDRPALVELRGLLPGESARIVYYNTTPDLAQVSARVGVLSDGVLVCPEALSVLVVATAAEVEAPVALAGAPISGDASESGERCPQVVFPAPGGFGVVFDVRGLDGRVQPGVLAVEITE